MHVLGEWEYMYCISLNITGKLPKSGSVYVRILTSTWRAGHGKVEGPEAVALVEEVEEAGDLGEEEEGEVEEDSSTTMVLLKRL